MAKVGNLQSGYKGKLDGQVYFKGADGSTIVRKITTPKNPKTLPQRVQRVITKTVGDNYKVMKAICDHSFEGKTMGFECANRFRSLNATRMRERAAYLQEQGVSLYQYYNFAPIGSTTFHPAAVFIAEGSLKQVYPSITGANALVAATANTYGDVINALGAQRGDQMTFVTVEKSANGDYTFQYVRVILDPRNENGAAPLSTPFIDSNAINCPNSRNKGNFAALAWDGGIKFKLTSGTVVAVGIIMSRKSESKWLRSNCQLVLSEENIGADLVSLMGAAESAGTVQIDVESEQYLNNAGEGGAEGSSTEAGDPDEPATVATLGNNVSINGASQAIGGGSATVDTLSSFAFGGSGLSNAEFHMTKNNGASVQPTTHGDSSVAWTITGSAENDVYRFYMGDTLKYTVTIASTGGDNGGGFDPGS